MAEIPVYEAAIRVAVALVSIFLFIVVAAAWRRRPSPRMRLVVVAFAIFLVEGLILLFEVFIQDTTLTESAFYAFQLVELLVLAAAVLKR